jgi:molybdopterin-guanine dinucleotide biosynthesis protein A
MPFVSAGLLRFLALDPRPLVAPEAGGRLHPLPARYSKELAGQLEGALARGEPLTATVLELGPAPLGPDQLCRFGAPERLLFNVNTDDELEEAECLLTASSDGSSRA